MVFAGHLGSQTKLAGVGLGTIMLAFVAYKPILGMNGAMETLVAQAYGAR